MYSFVSFVVRLFRSVEEGERAGFDALARRGAGGRAGIVEGAVRGEARGPGLVRVEHLEHQRLVALHAREVIPLVRRVVGDVVNLAGAVLVAPLDPDEALVRNAAAVADAERLGQHHAADRPPYLDDRPALPEAPLGLGVADDLAQP